MYAEFDWGPEGAIPGAGEVVTDGSSRNSGAGHRTGWGICVGPCGSDPRSQSGPVRGSVQIVPGAEGYAVAKVLTMVRDPVSVVTESTLVQSVGFQAGIRKIGSTCPPTCTSWCPSLGCRPTPRETKPAMRGSGRLPGDLALAQWTRRCFCGRRLQLALRGSWRRGGPGGRTQADPEALGSVLNIYNMVRGQSQRRAQEGLVARCKPSPRKVRSDNTWSQQHRLLQTSKRWCLPVAMCRLLPTKCWATTAFLIH